MHKEIITTLQAPSAIGTYSQAVKVGPMLYVSGQIPLVPGTMVLHTGDFKQQVEQVLDNLAAIAEAAGGSLQDIVKLQVYLIDLANFSIINAVLAERLTAPYPARAVVQVSALPKEATVEMDAILYLQGK